MTLKAAIEQEFAQPLLNAYGITECAPGISGVRAEAPRSDTSVGTVLPGIEVRLVGIDESGGRRCCRRIACPWPQCHARLLPCRRSDRGRDRQRRLVQHRRPGALRGRSAVHCRPHQGTHHPLGLQRLSGEVEAVLNAHPAVVQSAVVGRAVQANQEVVAYVQLLPGTRATTDDLMAHAARQLTAYKRPSEIVILTALPTSSTGKILKHRLTA